MNARERVFFDRHFGEFGHTMIEQPAIFYVTIDEVRHSFKPDFYCPDCQTFFEVSATRQAFHQDKCKIRAMRANYPNVNLEVVTAFGNKYHSQECGLDYKNGEAFPNDFHARKSFEMRVSARERLVSFVGNSPERTDRAASGIPIYRPGIGRLLSGHSLPNVKTSQKIHAYLDSIEQQQKTA